MFSDEAKGNGEQILSLRHSRWRRVKDKILLLLATLWGLGFYIFVTLVLDPHVGPYQVVLFFQFAVASIVGLGLSLCYIFYLREPILLEVYENFFKAQYPFKTVVILFAKVTVVEVGISGAAGGPMSRKMIDRYPEFMFNRWARLLFRARLKRGKYILWRDKLHSESARRLIEFIVRTFPEDLIIDKTHGFLGPAFTRRMNNAVDKQ